MDLLEEPANWPTIEPAINCNPNILYLDFPYGKNIASLLKVLVKNACDTNENIALARKKKFLAKNVYDADKDVGPVRKKRTWRKVALLSNKNIALARKKRIWGKKKVRRRKKKKRIKETLSVVELETNKKKLDSTEMPSSKVSNINSVVKPISELSNTSSKVGLGFGNEKGEESGDELIEEIETRMICNILISFLRVLSYLSIFLKMVNDVILKLPNIHPSINSKTISWIVKERVVFKIDSNKNNCDYFLTLRELQEWVHLVECQIIFLLRTGIYLFALIALSEISVCYYHLKSLCCCLNMVLYLKNKVLWDWLTQIWKKREELNYFFAMEEGC